MWCEIILKLKGNMLVNKIVWNCKIPRTKHRGKLHSIDFGNYFLHIISKAQAKRKNRSFGLA